MFQRNGRAGFVLKPEALRCPEKNLLSNRTQHFFDVTVGDNTLQSICVIKSLLRSYPHSSSLDFAIPKDKKSSRSQSWTLSLRSPSIFLIGRTRLSFLNLLQPLERNILYRQMAAGRAFRLPGRSPSGPRLSKIMDLTPFGRKNYASLSTALGI